MYRSIYVLFWVTIFLPAMGVAATLQLTQPQLSGRKLRTIPAPQTPLSANRTVTWALAISVSSMSIHCFIPEAIQKFSLT